MINSAERESLQYRIRYLEAQVQNLESMIEEIDRKNNEITVAPTPTAGTNYKIS